MIKLLHLEWENPKVMKQVNCVQNQAKKYSVSKMLTVGNSYDVINETDEFIFVIDDSKRVAGYYKDYFE